MDNAGIHLHTRHTKAFVIEVFASKPLWLSCGHMTSAHSSDRHTLPSLCIRSVTKFRSRCEERRIGNWSSASNNSLGPMYLSHTQKRRNAHASTHHGCTHHARVARQSHYTHTLRNDAFMPIASNIDVRHTRPRLNQLAKTTLSTRKEPH